MYGRLAMARQSYCRLLQQNRSCVCGERWWEVGMRLVRAPERKKKKKRGEEDGHGMGKYRQAGRQAGGQWWLPPGGV